MKKHYYGILLLFFLSLSCVSDTSDYEIYLDSINKEPFGTYVFEKELYQLFPDNKIIIIKDNFIDDVLLNPDKKLDKSGNYLAVLNNFKMNQQSTDELLNFVSEGNIAFIATNNLNFSDAIGVRFENHYHDSENTPDLETFENNLILGLYASNFSHQKYHFKRYLMHNYIVSYNDETTTALGYFEDEINNKYINFIRVQYGDGFFYLHSQPLVFSNHYMLQDEQNQRYVSRCLSYLKDGNVFFDGNQVNMRNLSKEYEPINPSENNENIFSHLDFFMSDRSLKTALYIAIFGFLCMIFIRAKRRQRVIPIIKPLENTSVQFAKTIANLYLNSQVNYDIAHKKTIYFLERIRTDLKIDTQHIDDKFINILQQKTQYNKKKLIELFTYIKEMQARISVEDVSDTELIKLDQLIEDFYTHTKI